MPVVVEQAVVVLRRASERDMAIGLQGVEAGAGGGDIHGTGIIVVAAGSTVDWLRTWTGDGGIISEDANHGWARICSNDGRSAGRYSRQRRIKSSH
jgi:hypothetical protein